MNSDPAYQSTEGREQQTIYAYQSTLNRKDKMRESDSDAQFQAIGKSLR